VACEAVPADVGGILGREDNGVGVRVGPMIAILTRPMRQY
jgi:hypothetical protein